MTRRAAAYVAGAARGAARVLREGPSGRRVVARPRKRSNLLGDEEVSGRREVRRVVASLGALETLIGPLRARRSTLSRVGEARGNGLGRPRPVAAAS